MTGPKLVFTAGNMYFVYELPSGKFMVVTPNDEWFYANRDDAVEVAAFSYADFKANHED